MEYVDKLEKDYERMLDLIKAKDERIAELEGALHKALEALGTCTNAPSVLAMQKERDAALAKVAQLEGVVEPLTWKIGQLKKVIAMLEGFNKDLRSEAKKLCATILAFKEQLGPDYNCDLTKLPPGTGTVILDAPTKLEGK